MFGGFGAVFYYRWFWFVIRFLEVEEVVLFSVVVVRFVLVDR